MVHRVVTSGLRSHNHTIFRNVFCIKAFTTVFLFIFLCFHANGNYIKYYELINKAEKTFVSDTTSSKCLQIFESAFKDVRLPFASDVFKAVQISFFLKDTAYFFSFAKLAFERDLRLEEFKYAPILRDILSNQYYKDKLFLLEKNSSKQIYDHGLKDSINRRFYEEQTLKRVQDGEKQFYQKEANNIDYFGEHIKEGKFPSDQLIGLFRQKEFEQFLLDNHLPHYHSDFEKQIANSPSTQQDDEMIGNYQAIFSFLHYPCGFIKYKEEIWKSVLNGYLQPKVFCLLEEWTVGYKARMESENLCSISEGSTIYLIWKKQNASTEQDFSKIEANRKRMYVQELKVDNAKKNLEKQTGIKFFYGFLNKI